MRKDSPTFGQYASIELSSINKKQLFVPRGFAHGFLTLSKSAKVFYKCDNYYNKEAEEGMRYDDGRLGIDWVKVSGCFVLSKKDEKNQSFEEFLSKMNCQD